MVETAPADIGGIPITSPISCDQKAATSTVHEMPNRPGLMVLASVVDSARAEPQWRFAGNEVYFVDDLIRDWSTPDVQLRLVTIVRDPSKRNGDQ